EGVQLNNRFVRYTGTLNLDHQATAKLSFGSNLTLARSRNDRVKGDNYLDGVYSGAVKSLPYYSPYNEQGELIGPNSPGYPSFPNFNPVGQALLPRFQTYATKILGGIFAEYAFLPNLRFRTKVSADYNDVTDDQFEPSTTAIGGYLPGVGFKGYGIYGSGTYSTLINSTTVTYSQDWNDAHHFSALLGNEVLQRVERTSQTAARLFPRDDFSYISSPDGDQIATVDQGASFINRSGLLSFFGEFKYDYQEKYLFSITAREDGSSRFGRERRFGFFPSFSAGWRISAEPFVAAYTFVDDLKLRASYGFTGNERIGEFKFLGTFSGATYSGSSGLAPNNLENASLQWESTRELNLGLDLSVLNGRVGLTFDVYDNLTSDLLYDRPVPYTTGFGVFTGNIGQVSNRGFEVGLNTVNTEGAFRWSTNFNLSHNVNKVVDIADSLPVFRGYTATPSGSTSAVLEGQPLGTFWGLRFRGVDAATGDAIYDDINGDGAIDGDDGTVIGNAQPVLIGGITNRFSWKGFDLSAFFQFSYGNEILNYSNQGLLNAGTDLSTNQVRDALRRWQKPGDITDVPRYEYRADQEGTSFNNFQSSRFVE
ncbi:MAG TPA: SusC/RagA family TonB-linked outer membrane protein, partial [Cytophagales bacterium]